MVSSTTDKKRNARTIVAMQSLDCPTKVRIYYRFPSPLTKAVFDLFPGARVIIKKTGNRRSGTSNSFKIMDKDILYAEGVIGADKLVVTYWKDLHQEVTQEVADLENRFESLGIGSVVHIQSSLSTPSQSFQTGS